MVERPDLVGRIEDGAWRPLTIVVGPAGFGKTTLVGQWLAETDMPVAWLSLEAADSEPLRFLTYVLASIGRIRPAVGGHLDGVVPANGEVNLIALLTNLLVIPLAEEASPFALVLDDYHKIQSPLVNDAVGWLLDNAPPCLHVVIITRIEPDLSLATRRARDAVTEIHPEELAFSQSQALPFFNEAMGLSLDADAATLLHQRTEGWAVGMQLASLSIKRGADIDEVLEALASDGDVADFLVKEILDALEPGKRSFLLDTSVLDRLSEPLCSAVVDDPCAAETLRQAFQEGLFLLSLDHRREWYRYHDLFREILQRRLRAEDASREALLQRRAAQWWMAQELPANAISLAIAAGADDLMGEMVERWGLTALLTCDRGSLAQLLEALPDDAIDRYPAVGAAIAWSALMPPYAPVRVDMALDAIARTRTTMNTVAVSDERRVEIEEHLLSVETMATQPTDDLVAAVGHMGRALERLPEESSLARVSMSMNVGWLHLRLGQLRNAVAKMQQAQHLDQPVATCAAMGYQASAHRSLGELDSADAACAAALDVSANARLNLKGLRGQVYLEQAKIEFERWNLPATFDQLEEAIPLIHFLQDPFMLMEALLLQVRAHDAAGDSDLAEAALAELTAVPAAHDYPMLGLWAQIGTWGHALARGEACKAPLPEAALYSFLLHEYTLYPVLFAIRGQDAASALAICDELCGRCTEAEYVGHGIDWQLARALALAAEGRTSDAASALADALCVSDECGIHRPVAEWSSLLRPIAEDLAPEERALFQRLAPTASRAATPKRAPERVANTDLPPLEESLSPRELEVLSHVREGLSNPDIAKTLFVSTGTIKTHMHRLLTKLGAKNRVEAIRIAEDYGLL